MKIGELLFNIKYIHAVKIYSVTTPILLTEKVTKYRKLVILSMRTNFEEETIVPIPNSTNIHVRNNLN